MQTMQRGRNNANKSSADKAVLTKKFNQRNSNKEIQTKKFKQRKERKNEREYVEDFENDSACDSVCSAYFMH